jgi:uncharacterized membrane protein
MFTALVLPSGFALPPLPYLVGLLLAVAGVVGLLYRLDPPITPRVVAAFAPWMVAGAAGYVLFQLEAVPAVVAPLFGSPAVYLSTFVLAGLVWAAVARFDAETWSFPSAPSVLLLSGALTAGAVVGSALAVGSASGGLQPFWPAVGLLVSVVVAGLVWTGLRRRRPRVEATGAAGLLVVLAHTLDGVSTAIGVDVLTGFGEQTPLSRVVLELGQALPTAQYVGGGWVFVLVKVALATGVVLLLTDYVEEAPREGVLLLGLVAAVGLGPGAHNLVLFTVA